MTMTPADFLAQPSDPDEDTGEELEQQDLTGHLASIAASLRSMAAQQVTTPSTGGGLADLYAEVTAELDDLVGVCDRQQKLLDQVLEVVKPSTSKLADKVREVLEPPAAADEPEESSGTGSVQGPPAADADVEDWRAYARSKGYQGPDIDTANRSQIRTMLGIEHS